MRDDFKENLGGNAGLYALAVGALVGAVLFTVTGLFRKAHDVESGDLIRTETAAAGH